MEGHDGIAGLGQALTVASVAAESIAVIALLTCLQHAIPAGFVDTAGIAAIPIDRVAVIALFT